MTSGVGPRRGSHRRRGVGAKPSRLYLLMQRAKAGDALLHSGDPSLPRAGETAFGTAERLTAVFHRCTSCTARVSRMEGGAAWEG